MEGADEVNPGLQLAAVWLARAAAWGAMAFGTSLVALAAVVVWRFPNDLRPILTVVPAGLGSIVVAAGWYADGKARARLRRPAGRRYGSRGFAVVRPADPTRQP